MKAVFEFLIAGAGVALAWTLVITLAVISLDIVRDIVRGWGRFK